MRRSDGRILTTHAGSLPRPDELVALMFARQEGQAPDGAELEAAITAARAEVIAKQIGAGVDVISDGEVSKPSYVTYVKERMNGFDGDADPLGIMDVLEYPDTAAPLVNDAGMQHLKPPACVGPISVRDQEAVHRDIAEFKAGLEGAAVTEAFMTAISPGAVAMFMTNRYYSSHEEYLYALGDVLKDEYRAIVEAGLLLQVDCPDIGCIGHVAFPHATLEEQRNMVELHLDVLNGALAGLPSERLRLHVCWGNYGGPHHKDIELKEIIGPVLRSRPAALLLEASNPRHAHEWKIFEDVRLPDGKVLVPGVIGTTNDYIEHPELVAQRIVQYANLVGRENVMAGTDCGFSTFVGWRSVTPSIVWPKLQSLAHGAQLATQQLCKK